MLLDPEMRFDQSIVICPNHYSRLNLRGYRWIRCTLMQRMSRKCRSSGRAVSQNVAPNSVWQHEVEVPLNYQRARHERADEQDEQAARDEALEVDAQGLHRKNWDGADNHTQELRQSQSGESLSRCLCDLNRSWMDESSQKLACLHSRKSTVGSAIFKKHHEGSAAQQISVLFTTEENQISLEEQGAFMHNMYHLFCEEEQSSPLTPEELSSGDHPAF